MQTKRILSGIGWQFAEQAIAQLITVSVSMVLARILSPEDYGINAIVLVFISIASIFVRSGLGSALIQKHDADDLDFSSVFYLQIIVSLVVYLVLFFFAPYITYFYGTEYSALTALIRVLGLRIIISAVNNIQHAYISRKMEFKKFFWATLFGTLVSAVVGIVMALYGYGPWALVAQNMVNVLIDTIVLFGVIDWRPKLIFSKKRLVPLIQYGWRILFTDALNTCLNSLRTLVIGKVYSSVDLAYYNKGEQLPSMLVVNLNTAVQSVLFPAMANIQDNKNNVKQLLRRMVSLGAFVVFPVTFGFFAVADQVIVLMLTEKWSSCIFFARIFCVSYSIRIISTTLSQSIKAVGRSDIYMKSTTIYKIIEILSIIISVFFGVRALAVSTAINAFLLLFIQFVYLKDLIDYSTMEFFTDLFPSVISTIMMLVCVYAVKMVNFGAMLLPIQIITGVVVYMVCSLAIRSTPALIILQKIRKPRNM